MVVDLQAIPAPDHKIRGPRYGVCNPPYGNRGQGDRDLGADVGPRLREVVFQGGREQPAGGWIPRRFVDGINM